jgi:hypothetical protein
MFPIEKPSMLDMLAQGAMGRTIPRGNISLYNLTNEKSLEKIADSAGAQIWQGFITFGSASAGYTGHNPNLPTGQTRDRLHNKRICTAFSVRMEPTTPGSRLKLHHTLPLTIGRAKTTGETHGTTSVTHRNSTPDNRRK